MKGLQIPSKDREPLVLTLDVINIPFSHSLFNIAILFDSIFVNLASLNPPLFSLGYCDTKLALKQEHYVLFLFSFNYSSSIYLSFLMQ